MDFNFEREEKIIKKYIESSLKRYLKKQRRITETLIITFLITGSIGYGKSLVTDKENKPKDDIYIVKEEDVYSGVDVLALVMKLENNEVLNNSTVIQTPDAEEDIDTKVFVSDSNNGIVANLKNNNGIVSGGLDVITGDVSSINKSPIFAISNLLSSGNGVVGDIENNNGNVNGELEIVVGNVSQSSQDKFVHVYMDSIVSSSGNGVLGSIRRNNGFVNGDIVVATGTSSSNTSNNFQSYSSSKTDTSGNGVVGNIENNKGSIRGRLKVITGNSTSNSGSESSSSGNGVIGNVENNNGLINGSLNITTGDVSNVYFYSEEVYSTISSPYSVNGVFGGIGSNSGSIKGGLDVNTGSSNLNSTSPSFIKAHSNLTSNLSGNGVVGDVRNNNGVINGYLHGSTGDSTSFATQMSEATSILNSKSSGNGVVGDVQKNSGLIRGKLDVNTGDSISSSSFMSFPASFSSLESSGNGIYGKIDNNRGTITGIQRGSTGYYSKDGGTTKLKDYETIFFSGNGIAYEGQINKNFRNTGLVAGSESAIAIEDENALMFGSVSNFGILAGREIIGSGTEIIAHDRPTDQTGDYNNRGHLTAINLSTGKYRNYGVEIQFNNDEDRSIASVINGSGGAVEIDNEEFAVLNTELKNEGVDSYKEITSDISYIDYIINGVGAASGTLTVDSSEMTLNNSIINGYEKAVTLNGESSMIAKDTIFNGGGIGTWNNNGTLDDNMDDYLEYTSVIEGDSSNNTVELLGSSVVNGSVNLGAGNDTMTIATTSQVNGDLIGGTGSDTLSLGDAPYLQSSVVEGTTVDYDKSLNIYNTISGFENIGVEGSVTLYETAKIEEGETLHINSNSTLNLRIDPTDEKDGKLVGHVLYESGVTVSGNYLQNVDTGHTGTENDTSAGTLNLVTNGLGKNSIIAMDGVALDDKLYVRTDSLINKAIRDGNDIRIDTESDLASIFVTELDPSTPVDPVDPIDPVNPTIPEWLGENHYKKLDKVYKSIVSSGDGNINAIYPTVNLNNKDEYAAGENLLLLLNDIFMANPYGYIAQASRETMGLFNEMVLDNPHSNQIQGSGWFMVA